MVFFFLADSPYTESCFNFFTTATSLQRPFFFSWLIVHTLNLVSTSLQWPFFFLGWKSIHWILFQPLYNGHFFFLADSPYTKSCFNFFTTATSLQWPPLYNGHFSPCGQSIYWLLCQPLYNGHLSTMATLLYRYWWDTRIFPYTKKSYLHRAQWRYYFYLSRVRILVSPWLLTLILTFWNRKYL